MQIFLIRHPQPTVASSVCYGQTDVELTSDALSNLEILADSLSKQLPVNHLLCSSPLTRCRALAEILHATPIYDARLKEMNFGEWEMRLWSTIPRQQLDCWAADPLHYEIPYGESVSQVRTRVLDFIHEKQKLNVENLVLVTHAGVMKIIFAETKKLAVDEWMSQKFNYGSLHQLELNQ